LAIAFQLWLDGVLEMVLFAFASYANALLCQKHCGAAGHVNRRNTLWQARFFGCEMNSQEFIHD
jgi:hypothetical protein